MFGNDEMMRTIHFSMMEDMVEVMERAFRYLRDMKDTREDGTWSSNSIISKISSI